MARNSGAQGAAALLLSRFSPLDQSLNPAERRYVKLGQRPALLLFQALGQHIRQGINRDTDGHGLRVGQLDTADHYLGFILHGSSIP
jgi:hypothetical protein